MVFLIAHAAYLVACAAVCDPILTRRLCTPQGRLAQKNDTVDPETSDTPTHIWSAAFKGDIPRIRQFLSLDNTLCNIQDKRGNTPVMFATMTDQTDVLADLLLAGGDVHIRNNYGLDATNYAKGPKKKKRLLKLVHQASTVGHVEILTKASRPAVSVSVASLAFKAFLTRLHSPRPPDEAYQARSTKKNISKTVFCFFY